LVKLLVDEVDWPLHVCIEEEVEVFKGLGAVRFATLVTTASLTAKSSGSARRSGELVLFCVAGLAVGVAIGASRSNVVAELATVDDPAARTPGSESADAVRESDEATESEVGIDDAPGGGAVTVTKAKLYSVTVEEAAGGEENGGGAVGLEVGADAVTVTTCVLTIICVMMTTETCTDGVAETEGTELGML